MQLTFPAGSPANLTHLSHTFIIYILIYLLSNCSAFCHFLEIMAHMDMDKLRINFKRAQS